MAAASYLAFFATCPGSGVATIVGLKHKIDNNSEFLSFSHEVAQSQLEHIRTSEDREKCGALMKCENKKILIALHSGKESTTSPYVCINGRLHRSEDGKKWAPPLDIQSKVRQLGGGLDLWDCPCRPSAGSDNPVTMRYSSGRAALRFVADGRLTLALSVTVDTFTIAELDVLVSPTLKRRVIPLRFVLNTCAIQVELLPLFRLTEGLSVSVCVCDLQSLVHCVEIEQAEVVVRSWRMESRNRIDSPRRQIRFATVAGDGWYNEDLDLRTFKSLLLIRLLTLNVHSYLQTTFMFRAARSRRGSEQERGLKQALNFFVPYVKEVIANSFSIFNMEKAVRQRIREGHATWSVLTVRGAWLDPGRFYCSAPTWLPVSVRVHGYASDPLFRRNTTTALFPRNNAAAGFDLNELCATLRSIVIQPGLNASNVLVVYEDNFQEIKDLVELFNFTTKLITSKPTYHESSRPCVSLVKASKISKRALLVFGVGSYLIER
ncbi:hypothetical protein M513_12485 [Trichuris suis]|uniref:Uncharacterized protein n=1 Tax=Trichuris suis TaxID=68888 RepID=A0A085LNT4_9BILA|nr:hypothetical protein M513_12485 [Trichuris suis]